METQEDTKPESLVNVVHALEKFRDEVFGLWLKNENPTEQQLIMNIYIDLSTVHYNYKRTLNMINL